MLAYCIDQWHSVILGKDYCYCNYIIIVCGGGDKYTVYRRIVNTPATEKLATEDEHKPAHCFAFFSGSQKTLKFKLI